MDRKSFLSNTTLALAGASIGKIALFKSKKSIRSELKLSLSQWALHRAIFGKSKDNYQEWQRLLHSDPDKLWQGELHPLDFPKRAKELGFGAVEYVNSLIFGHAQDKVFLNELKNRTDSEGVKNILIMVDEEGFIGHPDSKERTKAIENHYKWMEASKHIGCPYMRINAFSMGSYAEQKKLAAEGLRQLAEKAEEFELYVLIENHGGMSSHADWLVETIELADHELLGTVVDFDNFTFSEDFIWGDGDVYNRYEGVEKLMPYAKSVSAKTHAFDIQGYETSIDYTRMMKIVKASGYDEYICVEYEGSRMTEEEGILATKDLIEKTYPTD
ncbi:MAG: sugar phosphate isomerase/epimerase [Balneola sp.]|nr:MAG: sugar phosphate isomerase/epimerase [Balneola sp.]